MLLLFVVVLVSFVFCDGSAVGAVGGVGVASVVVAVVAVVQFNSL